MVNEDDVFVLVESRPLKWTDKIEIHVGSVGTTQQGGGFSARLYTAGTTVRFCWSVGLPRFLFTLILSRINYKLNIISFNYYLNLIY